MGLKDYTLEEIQQFWYESFTKADFAKKIGYKSSGHVKDFQKKCGLLDSDLGKNNPNKKNTIMGPKGKKIEDLTGKQFGRWQVLALDEEKTKTDFKHSWWICECNCEKHTVKSITMNNLKRGKTLSCGCNLIRAEDMIGKRYGRLIVLNIEEHIHNRRGKMIHCKCDCGKDVIVCCTDVKEGKTTSCGCRQEEARHEKIIDMTGKIFNYIEVLELDKEKTLQEHCAYWKCKCLLCGQNKSIKGTYIRTGHTKSCGCIKSYPELKISQILKENNILFKREFTFSDLKGESNNLRFDFAIFNNNNELKYLIEYQGEQHYKSVDFWGGEDKFKQQQEYDRKKQEYCIKKNIPLIILNKNNELLENEIIRKEFLYE